MRMCRLAAVLFALLALLPGIASAQAANGDDAGFLLRVNGDVRLAADDRADTVVVIDGDALIAGRVENSLIVISGDAIVEGEVATNIVVVNGSLDLRDTARVKDVTLVDSDLTRAPGATVTGEVNEEDNVNLAFRGGFVVGFFVWLAFTILVLVAGLLFAAVGGRQLSGAGALLTDRLGPTLLTTVLLWIVLPAVAVLLFFTLIGIPLGIAILVFLLPALWFLGYLVAGTRLGAWVLRLANRPVTAAHPYIAALVGLLIFQIVLWIPVLGGLVFVVAGLVGAGALAYLAWRAATGGARRVEPAPLP